MGFFLAFLGKVEIAIKIILCNLDITLVHMEESQFIEKIFVIAKLLESFVEGIQGFLLVEIVLGSFLLIQGRTLAIQGRKVDECCTLGIQVVDRQKELLCKIEVIVLFLGNGR